MSQNRSRRLSHPRVPRYSVEEYERSAASIKRVHEAFFDHAEELEKFVRDLQEELANKNEEIIRLRHEVDIGAGTSIVQAVLLIVGGVLSAFGVNLATSLPQQEAGWILSIGGYSIQVLVILFPAFLKLLRLRRGHR